MATASGDSKETLSELHASEEPGSGRLEELEPSNGSADAESKHRVERPHNYASGNSKPVDFKSTESEPNANALAASKRKPSPTPTPAATARTTPKTQKKSGSGLVYLLFFLSGLSSLIYQVVWTRELVLVFGGTTFATSTVLAIFMGGLALGSYLAGRYTDRIERPLRIYGILEGIIGAWALIAPILFAAVTPVYAVVWQHTHASLLALSLLRFAASCLILLVPTTCMGATLPILAKFVTSALETVGKQVGRLYALNTFGAICGALLGGFILLPQCGLTLATIIAAAINFLLTATAMLQKQQKQLPNESNELNESDDLKESEAAKPSTAPAGNRQDSAAGGTAITSRLSLAAKIVMTAFAASGAVAMIYEVCWTRALLMIIGSSTYAFTVMLSTFLIGIFLGSIVISRYADKAKSPIFWFAILQMTLGVVSLICIRLFDRVPFWNLVINQHFMHSVTVNMLVRFLLAGVVLIPITTCLGAIFPVVVRVCTVSLATVGRSIGTLYAANTVGAIVGAFGAGFVLLPLFGAEKTLLWSAFANFLLGAALISVSEKRKPLVNIAAAVAACGFGAFLYFNPNAWNHNSLIVAQADRRILQSGTINTKSFEKWQQEQLNTHTVVFWKDGSCSNVAVLKYGPKTSLLTNGHVDASDGQDTNVQSFVSMLPLMLKPDAKDIAVVGWGSGQTVGASLLFPIRECDAIELEPAVIKASKWFHHLNYKAEEDPRVHIEYNDGRNFLLATNKLYDLVISEPSNPWQSGVCNLFTREYFHICHKRLKPGGMFSLWLQTSEVPPEDISAVLSAVNKEYPHAVAFLPSLGNIVILASDSPITINFDNIKKQFENARIKKELRYENIISPESLLSRFVIASDGFHLLKDRVENTDDRNRLEFDVGLTYESLEHQLPNRKFLSTLFGTPWKQIDFGTISPAEKARVLAAVSEETLSNDDANILGSWAEESLKSAPTAAAYNLAGVAYVTEHQVEKGVKMWSKSLEMNPRDPQLYEMRGRFYLGRGDSELARADFDHMLQLVPNDKLAYVLKAQTYFKKMVTHPIEKGKTPDADEPAIKVLEMVGSLPDDAKFAKTRPEVLWVAGQAHFRLRHFDTAENLMNRYFKLEPNKYREYGKDCLDTIAKYKSGAL